MTRGGGGRKIHQLCKWGRNPFVPCRLLTQGYHLYFAIDISIFSARAEQMLCMHSFMNPLSPLVSKWQMHTALAQIDDPGGGVGGLDPNPNVDSMGMGYRHHYSFINLVRAYLNMIIAMKVKNLQKQPRATKIESTGAKAKPKKPLAEKNDEPAALLLIGGEGVTKPSAFDGYLPSPSPTPT